MLAFPNGLYYHNFDSKTFNGNILSTYCANLIKIGPPTPEITRATRGSAMAEGSRDALVSRNSAATVQNIPFEN